MKLISLNVEGSKHLDRTEAFIRIENPDVLCLQECDSNTISYLEKLGYTTHFLPLTLRECDKGLCEEGVALASRLPLATKDFIYFEPAKELRLFVTGQSRKTTKQGLILGTIDFEGTEYNIASNHFTWTPDGNIPNQPQIDDMETFLGIIKNMPAHCMCGDFNIPRNHNYLYEKLIQHYRDTVPALYKSSMDKSLHKHGANASKEIMFTDYMVDYIFSQPPYLITDVHLQFGVSDHAAVIATITL